MSAQIQPPHPVIRPLRPEDIDALVSIEEAAYPFPWSRGIFTDCIRVGYACYGLQLARMLAGYVIYNWAAVECNLLNLAVHPDWRRRGYGSDLLEHAISQAGLHGCEAMFLEVRPSNTDATRLYLKRGFEVIGRRPAYYQSDDGREDAIVMRMELQSGQAD